MNAQLRIQELDQYITRLWFDPAGSFDRLPDTGLGDWARDRIATASARVVAAPAGDVAGLLATELAAVAAPARDDAGNERPTPVALTRDAATGTVRVEFALEPGEQLYAAYDSDALSLNRRGDHVHLVGELHPRGTHSLAPDCALCEADDADRTPADLRALDMHDIRSNYGEMVIPWVISSRGYGVYIANHTSHGLLDLGHQHGDTWSYTAKEGDADIYLVGPGSMPELVRAFTRLTGRAPLPPTWALGFLQSRFGYESFDHAETAIKGFGERDLPVHGLIFDVQWLEDHVNLRWNPDGFLEPRKRLAALAEAGVRTIVITEPGTRDDASNYASGEAIDAFAVDGTGELYDAGLWFAHKGMEGYREITPARATLVNVFREDVADWWYDQHLPLLDEGVDAWWLDLNEPEEVGHDVRFRNVDWPAARENLPGPTAHNLFAIAQQRAFARRDRRHTNRRPFMLSRCASTGSQRYGASQWSGDIGATWQSMRVQTHLGLTAGLSGITFWGCDVGGFHDDPGPELFARWMQFGAFVPTFRAHGMMHDREPWSQGEEALAAIRPALTFRAQLLPSIATWVREATELGEPLMKPMLWLNDGDERWADLHDQFFFGPLLVAPVLEEGATSRVVEIPAGDWVAPFTGEVVHGPATIEVPVSAETIPVFLPQTEALIVDPTPLDRRAFNWPPSELEVWSFAPEGVTATCSLYVDDGVTRDYEQGAYSRQSVSVVDGVVTTERLAGAMPAPRLAAAEPSPGVVRSKVPVGAPVAGDT